MAIYDFFDEVESISLNEPLGAFLGGKLELEICYRDVVKLSGHSCPTVAVAYLFALYGLKTLYPSSVPVRGEIKVMMSEDKTEGVTGVIANVLSFITGAKENDGFKGIGGIFNRNELLSFGVSMEGEVTLLRTDTKASVQLRYNLATLQIPSFDQQLMQKVLMGKGTQEDAILFGTQWQNRVKTILLEHKEKAVTVF